jgi:hypothetical protein
MMATPSRPTTGWVSLVALEGATPGASSRLARILSVGALLPRDGKLPSHGTRATIVELSTIGKS